MKIYDITSEDTRIIETQSEFIHKCCDCSFFEMCERNGEYFLDTEEVLKDSEGYLRKNYCYNSDGIHLLPSGNIAVMNYIRTHGVIE